MDFSCHDVEDESEPLSSSTTPRRRCRCCQRRPLGVFDENPSNNKPCTSTFNNNKQVARVKKKKKE
jgi:hypothetical protein